MKYWYESIENLATLARYIIERDGSASLDVVYFLEKPYKWQNDWDEYQETLVIQ